MVNLDAAEAKPQGLVKEGLAAIGGGVLDANNVFYNPVQVFNRDLSIIILRVFATLRTEEKKAEALARLKKRGASGSITADVVMTTASGPVQTTLNILEPLAATGLRSIRYALELEDVIGTVVASDMDPTAVKTIETNRQRNNVSPEKLRAVCCDANQLMYSCRYGGVEAASAYRLCGEDGGATHVVHVPLITGRGAVPGGGSGSAFDIIDLDPYGSVAGFLDAAVQSVAEGGLLCLTSTDMPILCGNNPEVSFYKYGGTAVKARYMHEMALRLLVNAVAAAAARHKRVIQPLACCSIDFYVRCFLRVYSSPMGCKGLAAKTALAFQCTNCDAFSVAPLGTTMSVEGSIKYKAPQLPRQDFSKCPECDNTSIWIAGPFYAGPLYNKNFVARCLELIAPENEDRPYMKPLTMLPKLRGLLTAISEEIDVPLFYMLPSLMNRVKTETMKLTQFKSALLRLGYRVSHFHREPQSIKTDAPGYVVFDVLRKWATDHPPKNPEKFSILQKPLTFELHPDACSKSVDVSKWLPNPAPYWGESLEVYFMRLTGPKPRAKSSGTRDDDSDTKKRRTNT